MKAGIVIVGAGIAGVSAAYQLADQTHTEGVVVVDPRPPLTLTSDKSTECYRNWWPNRSMVGLMNRSIDLIEDLSQESDDSIGLNRRGYIYATAQKDRLASMVAEAEAISGFGAGEVRTHTGSSEYDGSTGGPDDGVDVLVGSDVVREHHPWLADDVAGLLHVRRAGWFSAQQAGSFMLDRFREAGGRLIMDEVTGIETANGRIGAVTLAGGETIDCGAVVNAAGPMSPDIAAMVGLSLPIHAEVHTKVTFRDHLGAVPRDLGMFIWSDPQEIDWSPEEREALTEEGRDDLLGTMPIFCHGRPEGGSDSPYFVGLWEYDEDIRAPEWPLPEDSLYAEVVMRGLTRMMPALDPYLEGLPHSVVDGGYYSKTRENRPLIGPAGPDGFHLLCAFSGFGVMVAAGAADLLARHVLKEELPDYTDSFLLSRYDDPDYLAEIEQISNSGQL